MENANCKENATNKGGVFLYNDHCSHFSLYLIIVQKQAFGEVFKTGFSKDIYNRGCL